MDKLNYTVHQHYIIQCTLSNWSLCLSPGLPAQGRRQRLNSWCHSSDHEQSATLAGRFGLKAWVWELLVVYSGKILYHNTTSILILNPICCDLLHYIYCVLFDDVFPIHLQILYLWFDDDLSFGNSHIVPEYSSQQCHLADKQFQDNGWNMPNNKIRLEWRGGVFEPYHKIAKSLHKRRQWQVVK